MKIKTVAIFFLFFLGGALYYTVFVWESAETKNRKAVEQQLSEALTLAEAMWSRPALMEGAGRDFTRLDEEELLLNLRLGGEISERDGLTKLTNEHATYKITILSPVSLSLEAMPLKGSETISVTIQFSDGDWIRE